MDLEAAQAAGKAAFREMLRRGDLIRALRQRLIADASHRNTCPATVTDGTDPRCSCGLTDLLVASAFIDNMTVNDAAAAERALRAGLVQK